METSIIIAVGGVLITVATNIGMWLIKVTKIEEKVEQTDKRVNELKEEIKEVRKESREEIKELSNKFDTKFDIISKEIAFMRGVLESLVKTTIKDVSSTDSASGFMIRDKKRSTK